ncbi:MAG: ferredoxin [Nanoarchaeota archaeon]|nr:ferredoxin [Nanoarchaeota archaeon]MBU1029666.1 ferredoxin [Nanoarchaeota archaeon]MBU1849876.1 ferredoxin [Nanoarchaeota archaeon]
MAKYKIKQDLNECIGCAACTAVCPNNWEMVNIKGEEKAKPKKVEFDEDELEENKEAAESCPVEIIHIETKSGDKII